jgi:putative ATP-dependent endonuclease of OLD family
VLRALEVRNFRALEQLDLDFEPLTALIGPNGTGKSSILQVLDIVLGAAWPTIRSFRIPQDFTDQDVSRKLSITIGLEPPFEHKDKLDKIHEIQRLQVRCLPYKRRTARAEAGDLHVDFTPLGEKDETPTVAFEFGKDRKPLFRPLTVGTEMREHCGVLFIDHRRSLAQHQPWMRGSLLARLLAPIRKELPRIEFETGKSHEEVFKERYQLAVEALRTPALKKIEEIIGETTRRTLGFLGPQAAKDVEVGFGFADPRNPLNALRLMYREGGIELPGETLGLGVQSAVVVAIFEAFRQLGGSIGTVLIEEPEMYLHPQAQRYFYNLLCELADRDECQVIYSTHSPIFVDLTRFEGIRLIRREPGAMTTASTVTKEDDISFLEQRREAQKMLGFTATRSELFFARRVLLVEGPGDELAARRVAEMLGHDIDAEDLSVIACGGKSGIPFIARLCRALEIPFWVLCDEDLYPEPEDDEDGEAKIRQQNEQEKKTNDEVTRAAGEAKRVFLVKPSLEDCLGIGRWAPDKPRRVAEELSKRSLDDLPNPVVNAVKSLVDLDAKTDNDGTRRAAGFNSGN